VPELVITTGEVTELYRGVPDGPIYDPDTVHLGNIPTQDVWRGLWRMPLTGLPTTNRIIESAILRLNQYQTSPIGGEVELRLTTRPWVGNGHADAPSWNFYAPGKRWASPGGDSLPAPVATATLMTGVLPVPAPLEIDVAALVEASTGDLAFLMRVEDEVNDYAGFTHFNTPDLVPTLTINYEVDATDKLRKGRNWLSQKRHAHMTHLVTYVRGGQSVQLRATVGRTPWEQSDDHGVINRFESRDFLVRAADLVIGSTLTTPQPGDLILDGDAYEVMAVAGQQCWRYSDPDRLTLRIHTKMRSSIE